jgi:uncharacterized protein (DUF2236 family)
MPPQSYFTDDSMVRRVHREFVVGLAGPRTLLLQASHPVAFAGFFAHTGALDEPYERLARTAQVMDAITFGPRAAADRMTRRVRAMHRRVRGELSEPAGRFPAGTPYAADDPQLLLWILAAIADSSLLVYGKYVRRLSRDEREAYWQDYKVIGRQFGLANQTTVGLLPGDIRRGYGLSWDPARSVALHGGAEYVRRVVVPLLPERLRLSRGARSQAA